MYCAIRPLLFKLDPEKSHSLTLPLLNLLYGNRMSWALRASLSNPRQESLDTSASASINCMGLSFLNPVGLAAGLDKNGDYIDGLGALGFGFIEVGTVTPKPQAGNSKPRLFRLADHKALINRMGFNNKGVDYLVERVKRRRYPGILGINIGKNASTPLEHANQDYTTCLRKVYAFADYVAVNISSPNTPGLRDLQHGEQLQSLFSMLKSEQDKLANTHNCYTPIAVKIAPDMDAHQLNEFAVAALDAKIDAVIATNTTNSRANVSDSTYANEAGGLSGAPLTQQATNTVKQLGTRLAGKIPIIGVGGIMDAPSALEKMQSGASLIQIYTGLIYSGPKLIKDLKHGLA